MIKESFSLLSASIRDGTTFSYESQPRAETLSVGNYVHKESEMEADHRPWGFYTILADEADHKVKRICVYPGKRLSLQRHRRRAEHWYLLAGEAVVTLDGREITLRAGEVVDIPCGAAHRLQNIGVKEVSFIEIQTGEYFGEDDIERFADDYGRV